MGTLHRPEGFVMQAPKKKRRRLSAYYRQILAYLPEYEQETGAPAGDYDLVAAWAYHKKKWKPPPRDFIRQLARDLARASAQDFISDENEEPVRWRYPVRDKKTQKTFWVTMDKASPEQIKMSAQNRRNGAMSDVLQIVRDLSYFNGHYNPGDPIQMSFNFDLDISERQMPTDYPDAPPES